MRDGKTLCSETAGFGAIQEQTLFCEREGLRYRGPHELFPPQLTIAQAADALAHVPALHHPGEKFTYGFSTDLLGRLIEIWSGEPLDRYLQRAVFEPLEMTDTGFAVPREERARFAQRKNGELRRNASHFLRPAWFSRISRKMRLKAEEAVEHHPRHEDALVPLDLSPPDRAGRCGEPF